MAGTGDIGGGSFWCRLAQSSGPGKGKKAGFKDKSAKKEVVVKVKGRKKPFKFTIHPGRKEVFVRLRWK